MKARICIGCAVLGLALVPVAIGAPTLPTLTGALQLCVQTGSSAIRDDLVYLKNNLNQPITSPAPKCDLSGQAIREIRYLRTDKPPPDPEYWHLDLPVGAGAPAVTPYSSVNKVIIIVHGAGANPEGMFREITEDIEDSGSSRGKTWVLAPQFLNECDFRKNGCTDPVFAFKDHHAATLRWYRPLELPGSNFTNSWGFGDESRWPTGTEVSSFDVLDHIIKIVQAKTDPNVLRDIVIVGFSQGARFVSTYSMGTNIENFFPKDANGQPKVRFRYIIGAIGTYPYLTKTRYKTLETEESLLPKKLSPDTNPAAGMYDKNVPAWSSCSFNFGDAYPSYHKFPMGMDTSDLPQEPPPPAEPVRKHYMKDVDITAYKTKHRLFLVGEQDVEAGPDTCEERMQGANRRNSMLNYIYHLGVEGAAANSGFCVLKGMGHGGDKVMGSHTAFYFWKDGIIDCTLNDQKCDTPGTTGCPTIAPRRR